MEPDNGTSLAHLDYSYDPAKAHEYYLRTRKLKGRKKSTSYTVKLGSGKTVKLSSKELVEQKAYAAKRINDIKGRLTELNTKLREAMRAAIKKRDSSKRESNKPPTAADKSKAARESRQYRDRHKTKLATSTKKAAPTKKKSKSADPVVQLEHRIEAVRGSLKAAVARQRALAGATRNG